MWTSTLLLGFVIGVQHAFEADHLAAVSALVSRKRGVGEMTRHGALWGLGHTFALLVVSGIVLFSPWKLPASFGPTLERFVGLLLIALGAQVGYRIWRDRVHVHAHTHAEGVRHLHLHSHRGEASPHERSEHEHEHFEGGFKTLLVGLTHGAAGSAALTVFVAASLDSPTTGLLYVVVFGLGSILGMSVLTAAIAIPLTATARRLTWANRGLQIAIATGSLAIGSKLMFGL